ncbi:hypothetical protein HLV40_15135 [Chromohalobacter salexigens]|nr:hypothetical protein [Chromohalobacter salexigens]
MIEALLFAKRGNIFEGGYFTSLMLDESTGDPYILITAPKDGGETFGNHAFVESFCETLLLNGQEDWRLPTVDECRAQYGIYKPGTGPNTTLDNDNGGASVLMIPPTAAYTSTNPPQTLISEFLDAEAFEVSEYWTSIAAGSNKLTWSFDSGRRYSRDALETHYARAVRRVYI